MSSTRPRESHGGFRAALRPTIAPTSAPRPATERARFITTLSADQHRQLRQLALDERLDASAIVRGALELIATDSATRARVLAEAHRQTW